MGKNKSDDKKKKKTSQLVIRIDKSERDAFIKLCDAQDTSAAREIRRFMREWVVKNSPASETIATEKALEFESAPAPAKATAAAPEVDAQDAAPPTEKPASAKRKRGDKTKA